MTAPTLWAPVAGASYAATVATRALLSALVMPAPKDGICVFVNEAGVRKPFYLSLDSGAAIDGVNVLATTLGGASRWLSQVAGVTNVTGTSPIFSSGGGSPNLTIDLTLDVSSGTFAARPAAGNAGRLYFATDTDYLYRDNGVTWDVIRDQNGMTLTEPPPVGNLTWVNQGVATAATQEGTLLLTKPQTGTNTNSRNLLVESWTGAFPRVWTVGMRNQLGFIPSGGISNSLGGIACRESATGKIIEYVLYWVGTVGSSAMHLLVNRLTNPTAPFGPYRDVIAGFANPAPGIHWLRITDEGPGGNLIWSFSCDAKTFTPFEQRARNDFFTTGPDERGVIIDNISNAVGNNETNMRYLSWS